MSTADNVWENVKTVFNMAEKKTAKAYELSKKKLQERKLEDRLCELYATLGMAYYASQKKGCEVDCEETRRTIILIDNTKAELKALRDEIKVLRFGSVCSKCGAGMRKDDDYCPKCGAQAEK